jgi:hypothetical protein
MSPALDDLFRCERFLSLFPRGMTVRACLRRQDEQRELKDVKGKVVEKLPVHPFCAIECDLGRASRAAAPAAPGLMPTPENAHSPVPVSSRLWTGEVPDVPIGAAPGSGPRPPLPNFTFTGPIAAATALRRSRDASNEGGKPATPEEQHHPEPPAEPAQESVMPCPECKSPTRHKVDCSKAAKGKPAPKETKGAKPARRLKVVKVVEKRRAPPVPAASQALPPVQDLPDEYLLACVEERTERVERIQREAQERVARLTGKAA